MRAWCARGAAGAARGGEDGRDGDNMMRRGKLAACAPANQRASRPESSPKTQTECSHREKEGDPGGADLPSRHRHLRANKFLALATECFRDLDVFPPPLARSPDASRAGRRLEPSASRLEHGGGGAGADDPGMDARRPTPRFPSRGPSSRARRRDAPRVDAPSLPLERRRRPLAASGSRLAAALAPARSSSAPPPPVPPRPRRRRSSPVSSGRRGAGARASRTSSATRPSSRAISARPSARARAPSSRPRSATSSSRATASRTCTASTPPSSCWVRRTSSALASAGARLRTI